MTDDEILPKCDQCDDDGILFGAPCYFCQAIPLDEDEAKPEGNHQWLEQTYEEWLSKNAASSPEEALDEMSEAQVDEMIQEMFHHLIGNPEDIPNALDETGVFTADANGGIHKKENQKEYLRRTS